MTHAAPKWHTTVVGGHIRNARAHVGETVCQDNCDVMSFGHGGPDMGFGPWEERAVLVFRQDFVHSPPPVLLWLINAFVTPLDALSGV
jgi:hypothetical protein